MAGIETEELLQRFYGAIAAAEENPELLLQAGQALEALETAASTQGEIDPAKLEEIRGLLAAKRPQGWPQGATTTQPAAVAIHNPATILKAAAQITGGDGDEKRAALVQGLVDILVRDLAFDGLKSSNALLNVTVDTQQTRLDEMTQALAQNSSALDQARTRLAQLEAQPVMDVALAALLEQFLVRLSGQIGEASGVLESGVAAFLDKVSQISLIPQGVEANDSFKVGLALIKGLADLIHEFQQQADALILKDDEPDEPLPIAESAALNPAENKASPTPEILEYQMININGLGFDKAQQRLSQLYPNCPLGRQLSDKIKNFGTPQEAQAFFHDALATTAPSFDPIIPYLVIATSGSKRDFFRACSIAAAKQALYQAGIAKLGTIPADKQLAVEDRILTAISKRLNSPEGDRLQSAIRGLVYDIIDFVDHGARAIAQEQFGANSDQYRVWDDHARRLYAVGSSLLHSPAYLGQAQSTDTTPTTHNGRHDVLVLGLVTINPHTGSYNPEEKNLASMATNLAEKARSLLTAYDKLLGVARDILGAGVAEDESFQKWAARTVALHYAEVTGSNWAVRMRALLTTYSELLARRREDQRPRRQPLDIAIDVAKRCGITDQQQAMQLMGTISGVKTLVETLWKAVDELNQRRGSQGIKNHSWGEVTGADRPDNPLNYPLLGLDYILSAGSFSDVDKRVLAKSLLSLIGRDQDMYALLGLVMDVHLRKMSFSSLLDLLRHRQRLRDQFGSRVDGVNFFHLLRDLYIFPELQSPGKRVGCLTELKYVETMAERELSIESIPEDEHLRGSRCDFRVRGVGIDYVVDVKYVGWSDQFRLKLDKILSKAADQIDATVKNTSLIGEVAPSKVIAIYVTKATFAKAQQQDIPQLFIEHYAKQAIVISFYQLAISQEDIEGPSRAAGMAERAGQSERRPAPSAENETQRQDRLLIKAGLDLASETGLTMSDLDHEHVDQDSKLVKFMLNRLDFLTGLIPPQTWSLAGQYSERLNTLLEAIFSLGSIDDAPARLRVAQAVIDWCQQCNELQEVLEKIAKYERIKAVIRSEYWEKPSDHRLLGENLRAFERDLVQGSLLSVADSLDEQARELLPMAQLNEMNDDERQALLTELRGFGLAMDDQFAKDTGKVMAEIRTSAQKLHQALKQGGKELPTILSSLGQALTLELKHDIFRDLELVDQDTRLQLLRTLLLWQSVTALFLLTARETKPYLGKRSKENKLKRTFKEMIEKSKSVSDLNVKLTNIRTLLNEVLRRNKKDPISVSPGFNTSILEKIVGQSGATIGSTPQPAPRTGKSARTAIYQPIPVTRVEAPPTRTRLAEQLIREPILPGRPIVGRLPAVNPVRQIVQPLAKYGRQSSRQLTGLAHPGVRNNLLLRNLRH